MAASSLFSNIITAIQLWDKYGGGVEKAVTIFNEIDDCIHGQHVIDKIEKVFLNNGIDIAAMIATASGAVDLTSIKGIQGALNTLGTTPALPITGALDSATLAAIEAFQTSGGLAVDGVPGPVTVAAIATKLGQ